MSEALKVLLFLASRAEGITAAMKAVGAVIQNARDQNREPTFDELKALSLPAEAAMDELTLAINAAEDE